MPGVLSGHRSASKLANGIRVLKKELFAIKKVSQVARPQVVSAGLCDDILKVHSKSLKSHQGCDIIDLFPGVGLWSSKLHNLLRPRRHILVEPQTREFLPHLKPLLDAPDSRYKLVDWQEIPEYWTWDRYIVEGLLPEQNGLDPSSPGKLGQNNSLLIVAHTDIGSHAPKLNNTTFSHRTCWGYFHSLCNSSGFHHGGSVRMLLWLSDEEKLAILPRTIAGRRRLAIEGDSGCHIEELAGGAAKSKIVRDSTVDLKSCSQVLKRMEDAGIHVPSARLDELPRLIRENDGREQDMASALLVQRDWEKELRLLEEEFAKGKFSQYMDCDPGVAPRRLKVTPEFRRLRRLRHDASSQKMHRDMLVDLIKEDEDLDSAVLAVIEDQTLTEEEREKQLNLLDHQILQHTHKVSALSRERLKQFNFAILERRAFKRDPPLLLWDRRRFEPIIAKDSEFYGKKSGSGAMALLDFQPRSDSLSPLTPTQQSGLEVLRRNICNNPSDLLTVALEGLAPGAAQAIIPHAPSLRDPRKGGRRNINEMRAGLVTMEMFREMAVAWDKWHFKPTMDQMRRAKGASTNWHDRNTA